MNQSWIGRHENVPVRGWIRQWQHAVFCYRRPLYHFVTAYGLSVRDGMLD